MKVMTGAPTRRLGAKTCAALFALPVALLALAGPASAKTATDEATAKDPFEKVNRGLFLANGGLDIVVIRPASMTYKRVMPRLIRTGLHNAFSNMGEPTVAMNDILQGHGKKAVVSIGRLAVNSTVGLGGLLDVASRNGLPHHDNDFGITLAKRGFPAGPYLFLPLLGPATTRDAAGYLLAIGLDPFTYLRFPGSTPIEYGKFVGIAFEQRADADKAIKAITATSTDDYASFRSAYLQNREAQITGGQVDVQSLPTFDDAKPPSDTGPAAPKP
ncbi:MAG: MlaA family lipoprotein [Caulobacteraceae bacterium]